jgi:hypothetical protein
LPAGQVREPTATIASTGEGHGERQPSFTRRASQLYLDQISIWRLDTRQAIVGNVLRYRRSEVERWLDDHIDDRR